MKALILNSGMGSRMGVLTSEHPKCMTDISSTETILSRQLQIIVDNGIKDVVITTGYYDEVLIEYCNSLKLPLNLEFIKNPIYDKTNYIYSMYCAKESLKDNDIIFMHGDLVFEEDVFKNVCEYDTSCMTVSSTVPLPEKDFKAVIDNGKIVKVGIEFFDDAMAAQPLYKLKKEDFKLWMDNIIVFCENDKRTCYAENAFNEISKNCNIVPYDVENALCSEIDNPDDLEVVSNRLKELKK